MRALPAVLGVLEGIEMVLMLVACQLWLQPVAELPLDSQVLGAQLALGPVVPVVDMF